MIIECRHLTFRYPGKNEPLFEDLNCRISGPGFHALFGASGVGKTTLAKILAGEIQVPPAMVVSDARRILFSYNLERLPGWCAVGDHLETVCPEMHRDRMAALVSLFGLEPCLQARFSKLSLGQRNRANLIRYLLQDFDFLIMDESLANVDEATRERIILGIKERFPQKAFVYISHNVQEVSKLCSLIVVLRAGEKRPRSVAVQGQDSRPGQPVDAAGLERTMLEVVHAA